MPLPLEPGAKLAHVLPGDRDKTDPPKFFSRAVSYRESRLKRAAIEQATEARDEDLHDRLFGQLRDLIVGWELKNGDGAPVPFDLAELDNIISPIEAWQLWNAAVQGAPTFEDKKKSE